MKTIELFLLALLTTAAGAQPATITSVTPSNAVAGHYGTWSVQITIGNRPLASGAALRIQLPDTWHAGARNSAIPIQASRPDRDHYVTAHASSDQATLEVVVEGETDEHLAKGRRLSLDCREERYVFVVRVNLTEGELSPGDTITVVYGDTASGSRGMLAGDASTLPEPVLGVIDPDGSGSWVDLNPGPMIQIQAGPPAFVNAIAPSDLLLGEPANLRISVTDRLFNPVHGLKDDVTLAIRTGQADFPPPDSVTFGAGFADIPFTPTAEGVLRLDVSLRGRLLTTRSNPMIVHRELPEERTFWGDLHSHSQFSWDGVGSTPFAYARDIAGLDFYALTDHSFARGSSGCPAGLGPEVWDTYTALTDEHLDEGSFVTLHAYEASFGAPFGHHNVYFRGAPGAFVIPSRGNEREEDSSDPRPLATLPEFWELLEDGQALTIPHHTGKFPQPVSWDHHDAEHRRNFELYSAHGLSESYDPDHPLAFEQSDFTSPGRSVEGPQFAQDAWAAGLHVSPIAASDDHRSQPGKPHFGLAAIQAPNLTRSEIFDGLHDRRTYATSGSRILMDFSISGVSMGQRLEAAVGTEIAIQSTIHATGEIAVVELLRYTPSAGSFEVVRTDHPAGMDFELDVSERVEEDTIYYIRMSQRDPVRGRAAMAWSGPIWVDVG